MSEKLSKDSSLRATKMFGKREQHPSLMSRPQQ